MYNGNQGYPTGGNSSFENDFMSRLHGQSAPVAPPPAQKKGFPKWVIFAVIGAVVVIIALAIFVAIVSNNSGSGDDQISQEFYDNAYDETGDQEELNDAFKSAAAKNEHASYMTELPGTEYCELTPTVVAGALNFSFQDANTPADSTKFKKIGTLNSNALDYYLDQGNIVSMVAIRDGFEATYLIYGRSASFYVLFNPALSDEVMYLSRKEVFDDVTGVPNFYILEALDNGI